MPEKSSKSAEGASMLAASLPRDKARTMVLALGGQREWGDTKERFRERCAWKLNHLSSIAFTFRRVRAILSNEKIRLSADEYAAIERAYDNAATSLSKISQIAQEIRTARPHAD